MGKATAFKIGRYIHRVHPKKCSLKIWEKRERGRIQGLPKVFKYPPIISGRGKATDFKFGWYIHRVYSNKSPLKSFEKRVCGRLQGLSKVFKYPQLSQERVKPQTSNLACTFSGSMRTKAIKNFAEKRAWVYPVAAQNFKVPAIISGTGKATNFKFCTHFHTIDYIKFFGPSIYRAHHTVFFAIARLSC